MQSLDHVEVVPLLQISRAAIPELRNLVSKSLIIRFFFEVLRCHFLAFLLWVADLHVKIYGALRDTLEIRKCLQSLELLVEQFQAVGVGCLNAGRRIRKEIWVHVPHYFLDLLLPTCPR